MKTKHRLLHLSLIICLVWGWAAYIPAASPNVALADNPPPPPLEEELGNFPPPPAAIDKEEAELRAGLAALERARNQGPEAVVALLDTLRGPALDLAMNEILEAQEQLARSAPPRPEGKPVSEAEELAALQANLARDAANRARALARHDVPAEGQTPIIPHTLSPMAPNAPTADLTVGSAPCTHATIAAAIAAANPGDRLRIEGGVTFNENVVVNKDLTLQGGYNGCGSGSTARTTIDGGGSGTVVIINASLNVTLTNLNLTNGISPESGGGIRFNYEHAGGLLNLNHVDIYGNSAIYGGGIWVGMNGQVVGTDVDVYNNTASGWGGGVRLLGGQATFSDGDIHDNTAPRGAGVYGTELGGFAPQLDLPTWADLRDNQALTGDGFGGGLYMAGAGSTLATVNIADCSDLYSNDAIQGGGAYLISTTLTIEGDCSEIQSNTATDDGGGIYAQSSAVNLDNQAELISNQAGYGGGNGSGGGAYLDNGELSSDMSQIRSNTASDDGGGVYAVNGSLLDMDPGGYTCLGPRCSRLAYNTATNGYGGGVYASESEVDLRQTFVENNTSTWGGGVYAWRDPSGLRAVYAYNCLFARNNGNGADGIRLLANPGQTTRMIGSHNTLAYNPSTGNGTAIAMGGTGTLDLSLDNSVVWGHTTSINLVGQTVTCSDVQGGYAGTGNINADPLFVSTADANFHIQTNSPAVDQCASGQSEDFDNAPRPVDIDPPGANDYDMGADEAAARVGINGVACAYFSIQDAVDAASAGDTIQAAGDTFYETVNINKSLTIAGGYDFATCNVSGAGDTTIDGSAGAGSTVDVTAGAVTLRNLRITGGGDAGTVGGGLDVVNSGVQVTLDSTDVTGNDGSHGGGIYVTPGAVVTLTNYSNVSSNTAAQDGGGARVWGTLVGSPYCYISSNSAPNGGGLSVPEDGVADLNGVILYYNQATGASPDGKGGGILIEEGEATLSNNALVLGNSAVFGGGLYVDASTLDLNGDIYNNTASNSGGGLYADGGVLNLSNAQVGGPDANQPNQLSNSGNGAGLFLSGTHASLVNTVVTSNTFPSAGAWGYGGGLYLQSGSIVTLTNSTVERHRAPSSSARGAGLYVWDSTVTLDNSQVLSNTSEGAGGGVRLWNASTLNVLNGSELRNNQALNEGGGIAAAEDTPGYTPDINISNSTLRANTASTDGGAVYLDGGTLDFTGWWALYDNQAGGDGGAVAVDGTGDADFNANGAGSSIIGNQAGGNGGALYIHNNDTVQLYSTQGYLLSIGGNQAGGNGGAVFADNGAYFDVYGHVVIALNQAPTGNGGAFYLSGGSRLWLDDYDTDVPQLWSNWAQNGGAIYAAGSPRVECDGAEFGHGPDGNSATAGSGGALYLSGSDFDADNCAFGNNQATLYGGAIAAYTSTLAIDANYSVCNPPVQCSNLYSNTADSDSNGTGYGGAIYLNDGKLSLNHTYLHRNTAERGGAIHQEGGDPSVWISNTLFYSNTSTSGVGAGVRVWNGVMTATHTTFAHNAGSAVENAGGTAFVFNSMAWGNTAGFVGTYDASSNCNIDQSGTVGANVDPQFVAPGAGEDYHLQGGSPAIDACATGLSPDLDNVPRPFGAGYDMGAYEFASGVELAPDRSGSGLSPSVVMYTHTLTNTGGVTDTYTLSAHSSHGWSVTLDPAAPIALSGGQAAPIIVSLGIPAGVLSGTLDTLVITATSGANPSLSASVTDTTSVFTSSLPLYTLTTYVVGNGSITRSPSQTTYISGTVVQLTAVPDAGWSFAAWSGDLSGSANPDDITIDSDKVVTATFTTPPPTYTLTVNVVGNGSVTRSPSQTTYISGTVVQLTAVPDTSWYFISWSGDLSTANNPANLTMNSDKVVTATFSSTPPPTYTLTVNIVGNGSVTRSPSQTTYISGTVVQLTAVPDTSWSFTAWSGDLSGSANPDSLTMDNDKIVTATFSVASLPTHTLTVNIVGNGSVTRSPSQTTYISGTVVQLTAVPDTSWYFISWSGDLSGSANPDDITMDSDKVVTATFSATPPSTYTLTINVVGNGSVTRSPSQTTYISGTVVQLTAVPDTSWYFISWSGDLSTANNPANLTMNSDKVVTATFSSTPPPTYTLTVNIVGNGSVTRSPSQTTYISGTLVQLTAVPDTSWSFTAWSGDLSGSANPSSITMDSNKIVTATFSSTPPSTHIYLPLILRNS